LDKKLNHDLTRVICVGSTSAGKTTFTKALAEILGQPRIDLDSLHHGLNQVPIPVDAFRSLAEHAISGECWIVDGSYSTSRDIIWPKATVAIWLNYSFPTVFRRCLWRSFRYALFKRASLLGKLKLFRRFFLSRGSSLWRVIRTFGLQRRDCREMLETRQFPQVEWIVFRKPIEAKRFLRALSKPRPVQAAAYEIRS
jgi:adenylate kinase family enzyme